MKNIIDKPYLILWSLTFISISFGLNNSNIDLEINFYDTYYIINYNYICYLISLLSAIIGFGYWLLPKLKYRFSDWLTFIHIALTYIGVLFLWITLIVFHDRNYVSEIAILESREKLNLLSIIFILLILIGKLFYVINVITALIKNTRTI